MYDRAFFLKNLWLWKCDKKEVNMDKIDFNTVRKCTAFPDFEDAMRVRMQMGTYRYGDYHSNAYQITVIINDAIRRLKKYQTGGSKELLVDVANFCAICFTTDPREMTSIDDGEHVDY